MKTIILTLLFLSVSLLLFYKSSHTPIRNGLLLIINTLFYYYWEQEKIILLYLIILFTWGLGKILTWKRNKSILAGGILVNVSILLFYKYVPFLNIQETPIILPIGLSFYTFQSISFLVDIYKKEENGKNSFLEVANYLAFFPKILAGPIEKSESFISQLKKKPTFKKTIIFTACKIILFALCCKYVIADRLGGIINASLYTSETLSSTDIITVSGLYSFQIFFDFYAYSILAIGVARLYGIKLSRNFNYPYFSSSIKDFWKRWNITLTSWLKTYIYIPLGGNRVSTGRWIINSLVVFLVSGCWHGGTINYLLWGAGHGILYVTEQYNKQFIPIKIKNSLLIQTLYKIVIFILISLLWLIFRTEDFTGLHTLFRQLVTGRLLPIEAKLTGYFLLTGFILWSAKKTLVVDKYIFKTYSSVTFILTEICIINLLLGTLLCFSETDSSPFIYFKY